MTNLLVLVCFLWSPNTETNLAGYKLSHGPASGVYTNHIGIPRESTNTCLHVVPPQYFILRAVDDRGVESLPSRELALTNTPSVDVVLEWTTNLTAWRPLITNRIPVGFRSDSTTIFRQKIYPAKP